MGICFKILPFKKSMSFPKFYLLAGGSKRGKTSYFNQNLVNGYHRPKGRGNAMI